MLSPDYVCHPEPEKLYPNGIPPNLEVEETPESIWRKPGAVHALWRIWGDGRYLFPYACDSRLGVGPVDAPEVRNVIPPPFLLADRADRFLVEPKFDDTSRNATDDGIRRHVFCHNSTCRHHGAISDRYAAHDRRMVTYPHVIADCHLTGDFMGASVYGLSRPLVPDKVVRVVLPCRRGKPCGWMIRETNLHVSAYGRVASDGHVSHDPGFAHAINTRERSKGHWRLEVDVGGQSARALK